MATNFRDTFSTQMTHLLIRRATVWQAGAGLLAAFTTATLPEEAGAGKRRKKKWKNKNKNKNAGGPTCAETCHGSCDFCATRAAGPPLCGSISGGGTIECGAPCFSDNDCVGTSRPYCITHFIDRETGQTQPPCPSGGGWCLALDACGA